MSDADGFDVEASDRVMCSGVSETKIVFLRLLAVVEQPALHEPDGMRRPEDGGLHPSQQVRQPANVVLVAVRDEDSPDPVRALDEPVEVRVNDVHPQVVAREPDAAIDDQDVRPLLYGEAIHTYLAQAAERREPDISRGRSFEHDPTLSR
jgi:hypothetical protein